MYVYVDVYLCMREFFLECLCANACVCVFVRVCVYINVYAMCDWMCE